ncbi:hypothetical protein FQR65_LT06099 [Abscondita terminalis]|nr:hypothetical protein FQR65_LT06099 [Abscondita terminalis]
MQNHSPSTLSIRLHKYEYWEKREVPSPNPSLLFGNISEVVRLKKTFGSICHEIYKLYPNDAIVGFYSLSAPALVVRDVNLIKELLIKEFYKFQDHVLTVNKNVDPILGANLICLKGLEWKESRTQLTPQFTLSKLKLIIPGLRKVGNDLLIYIQQQIDLNNSNCFGVQELSRRFTSEAVFMSAFGLEGKSFTDTTPIAFQIGEEIAGTGFALRIKHLIGFLFPFLGKFFRTTFVGSPVTTRFKDIIVNTVSTESLNIKIEVITSTIYQNYVIKIIQVMNDSCLHQSNLLYSDQNTRERIHNCLPSHTNLLSLLPVKRSASTTGHAFTYYLNGFETSAVALNFLLYELALNQDIQEKCRKEIKTVLENDDRGDAVTSLKYIENVIYETLRKHSPLTVLLRYCTSDCTLPQSLVNGRASSLTIEKNTMIAIPIESIHWDPLYYPNPEVFDPDRFTDASKLPFYGFGDGPRTCLGRNFAILQIKIFIATVLSEYKLTLNEKTVVPYEQEFLQILNFPKEEIYVNFEKL